MLKVLKYIIKLLPSKWWFIGYFISILVAGISFLIFFLKSTHSVEEIAIVIAIPIMVIILGISIISYLSPKKEKAPEKNIGEEVRGFLKWILVSSVILLLALCLSFFSAVIFSISSLIYSSIGFEWAYHTAWFSISIPSFLATGGCFGCLFLIVMVFICALYWQKAKKVVKDGLLKWRGLTKDFRINGFKIPLH